MQRTAVHTNLGGPSGCPTLTTVCSCAEKASPMISPQLLACFFSQQPHLKSYPIPSHPIQYMPCTVHPFPQATSFSSPVPLPTPSTLAKKKKKGTYPIKTHQANSSSDFHSPSPFPPPLLPSSPAPHPSSHPPASSHSPHGPNPTRDLNLYSDWNVTVTVYSPHVWNPGMRWLMRGTMMTEEKRCVVAEYGRGDDEVDVGEW